MHRLATWRFELFVLALAAVEVASVAAADVAHEPAALVTTLVSALALLGCRWQPLAATVAAFGALTVSLAVQPTSTTAQFFGTLATFAVAGAVNREREAVIAWGAGAGLLGYAAWVDPYGGGAPDFLLSLAFGTTMWGAGLLVARRGRHVRAAVEHARQADELHRQQTAQALSQERAAIARELHDVVSHGLSVVVVQTVAARSRLQDVAGAAGGDVDRHLAAVEDTARDALGEMRRMLGLLHQAGDADVSFDGPAPGLRHVDDLVERVMRGQGATSLRVDCPSELPAGLELAVYRIIQEALTNVVKHAPGASVEVEVAQGADAVQLTVCNGPPSRPAGTGPAAGGHGLVGVRERVALYGGAVTAQPTADGGFRLAATFPFDAATATGTAGASAPSRTA